MASVDLQSLCRSLEILGVKPAPPVGSTNEHILMLARVNASSNAFAFSERPPIIIDFDLIDVDEGTMFIAAAPTTAFPPPLASGIDVEVRNLTDATVLASGTFLFSLPLTPNQIEVFGLVIPTFSLSGVKEIAFAFRNTDQDGTKFFAYQYPTLILKKA